MAGLLPENILQPWRKIVRPSLPLCHGETESCDNYTFTCRRSQVLQCS